MVSKETPNADGQTDLSLPTEPSSRSQKVAAPRERETSFLITADNSLPFRNVSN